MKENDEQDKPSLGMTLGDIYFVLFRRKWIILVFSVTGLVAAALLLFVVKPPKYQSQAKLLIKYVVENKSPVPHSDQETTKSMDVPSAIMNTEGMILHSLDLAREVVANVGAEKILASVGGGTNLDEAAAAILNGLETEQVGFGGVLVISFQHPNKDVVQEALNKIIVAYYKKHAELHQPVEISNFLTKEIARLRGELARTEDELRVAKAKTGVFSPESAQKGYPEEITKIRENLFDAQASLAAHQSALGEVAKIAPANTNAEAGNPPPQIPTDRIKEYRGLCARLELFSRREQELLTQFTDASKPVQEIRKQIAEVELLKNDLEEHYPGLAGLAMMVSQMASSQTTLNRTSDTFNDPATEHILIRSLKSKIEVLNNQLAQIQAEAAKVDEAMVGISELQRKKDQQESDLKYFLGNLETSRINESLGSEIAPNISVIDSPTPPVKKWSKQFKKKVGMVAAGGIFGGLALAFLLELFLDRTVKRPGDIENKLRLPLLISIPDAVRNGRSKKQLHQSNAEASALAVAGQNSADMTNTLSRFYTGLRDRLLVHFEVQNLTRKPKLVAVTSCHRGAGVSSTAAGLAASLSETGDGNVLLVDMNPEQQVVQQFRKGKLDLGLASALEPETKKGNLVQEKLYVVTERTDDERVSRFLPKRFSELVPQLKASDYDYIIFDMPPVSPISVTPRLAGLMDMVLLVIESEKTNQDVVKKVNALLAESKANVTTVLNKTHNYVPAQLHQEYLHDA